MESTRLFDQLPSLSEVLKDNPAFLDEAIAPAEASQITNTPLPTLETMRCRGGGPMYGKRGSRVFYTRRWCLEWLNAGKRRNTSEAVRLSEP